MWQNLARGRKRGRLYPQIKDKVYEIVKKYPGASTHEVSLKARVSWSTARKYLYALKRNGKIKSRRRGKKSIWF